MTVWQTIGNGFKVANRNLWLVLLLFGFYVVTGLDDLFKIKNTSLMFRDSLRFFLILMNFLIVTFIFAGLINYIKEVLKNEQSSIRNFWYGGKKFYFKMVCFSLPIIIPFVGFFISVFLLSHISINLSTIFIWAMEVMAVLFFLSLPFIVFSPFIIVDKDENFFSAIKQSFNLVAKNFWKTIFLILILVGLGYLFDIPSFLVTHVIINNGLTFELSKMFIEKLFSAYFGLVAVSSLMSYYLSLTQPSKYELQRETESRI